MDLTDAQWQILAPSFRHRRRADGRGRPPTDARAVVNGILWVLRTGAPWHDLPTRYPPYQTCHRRFQHWQRSGQLLRLLQRLAEDLRDRGKLDLSECFIDAIFSWAKKGAPPSATRRGKGSKIMAIGDRHGLPLAIHVASDSPHEVKLVDATLAARFVHALPTRLIGDRAYDSDQLDQHLATTYDIELIAPHNPHRRSTTQDGRPLRHKRRRWKIERLFAWLHNFRRVVTRWERHPTNFLGMIHLASALILLRHF